MRGATLLGAGVVMLLAAAKPAATPLQDPPAAAAVPGPLPAFIVYDGRFPPIMQDGKTERDPRDRTNRIHCFVCEYGLAPTFILFLRADPKQITADSPMGQLIRDLDTLLSKHRADKLSGLIVFLRTEAGEKAVKLTDATGQETTIAADKEYPDDENRDRYVREIRDWIQALKLTNVPVALAPLTSKTIKAWNVQDQDAAALVVYRRLKLVAPMWHWPTLNDLNAEQIKTILQTVMESVRY
ncbi:MAG: hypothetical protein NZ703_10425 [Gemmataceae bacterium]|nr:hypothetical protein [Gemmataceae bacterium]MCS7271491.1 hypothetical protein [Gemmataceae bacterium]MDW8242212.1 hypothetical protein [Thermogemmata sp.]